MSLIDDDISVEDLGIIENKELTPPIRASSSNVTNTKSSAKGSSKVRKIDEHLAKEKDNLIVRLDQLEGRVINIERSMNELLSLVKTMSIMLPRVLSSGPQSTFQKTGTTKDTRSFFQP